MNEEDQNYWLDINEIKDTSTTITSEYVFISSVPVSTENKTKTGAISHAAASLGLIAMIILSLFY